MTNRNKVWISDLIGEDYKNWKNEFIVLDAGTGCGKTYFSLNVLGRYALHEHKKILYLCNRRKLRKEMFEDIKKFKVRDAVRVETYQALQKKIQNNEPIPDYDYIVADECHYFTTDAKFNDYTDVSYKYLMSQKNTVVLWVSATAKIFFKWLEDKNKVKKKNIYRISKDYSYVKNLFIYQKDELTTIIDDILVNDPDSKIVVFCNAGDRMKEMYKIYGEEANYYCSNSSSSMELKKICGYDSKTKSIYDCIKTCEDGRITFEKPILFTTTVLDNGSNLKDEKIRHIFSEIFDVDSMIQSFGRKRKLNINDTCTFYVREYQPKAIQGMLNINAAQLEPVDAYKNDYNGKFYKEYGSGKKRRQLSRNKIFYSYFAEDKHLSRIKVNECRYRKYQQDNNILMQMKELGYVPILCCLLGEQLASVTEYIVVDVKKIDMFLEYLKSIEGKPLYSEERKLIKEEFETIGVKLRYTGINTFNGALTDLYKDMYECRFYNMTVEGKYLEDSRRKLLDGTDNPNRGKKYWILENRQNSGVP